LPIHALAEEGEGPETATDIEVAINAALSNIADRVTVPEYGNEWPVIALARSAFGAAPEFFEGYWNRIVTRMEGMTNPRVSTGQSTDQSRVILALSAIGRDARDVGGHNLVGVGGLADLNWVTAGTINNPIYALLALDSNRYELPEPGANITTREALIQNILSRELAATGGWALIGTAFDPDVTSMAITALAPYYATNAAVKAAIDRALVTLSDRQLANGGWMGAGLWAAENSQSIAQVIVALSALGIDAREDTRFIKNGNDPVTALLGFQSPVTGGFWNQRAQIGNLNTDAMATNQGAYALVAYWRFVNEMNSLYDMRDAFGPTTPAVDRTALQSSITAAEGRTQANYTSDSWSTLETALSAAIVVFEDVEATQAEVDKAREALDTAIGGLVEAGDTGGGGTQPPPQGRVTLSVIDPNYHGPGRPRTFLSNRSFEFDPGDTVYDILRRTGLTIVSRGSVTNADIYVESINGWGEFDAGPLSGWMYRVNGTFPSHSAAQQVLRAGDRVEWLFTRDLGEDIGGDAAIGGGGGGPIVPPIPNPDDEDEEEDEDEENGGGVWESPFADVTYDRWYFSYVRFSYTNELMRGTGPGEFSPHTYLSRGMLVTILWRLAGEPTVSEGNGFSDVESERWYSEAALWASANGIARGYGDGRFGPGDYITREQLALMLQNFAAYQEYDAEGGSFAGDFEDTDGISGWALDAMQWANANGLLSGRTETTLVPGGTTTRAEAAAVLYRFIENIAGGM